MTAKIQGEARLALLAPAEVALCKKTNVYMMRERFALACFLVVYLVLASARPYGVVMWQRYDDGLYIRLARSLAAGDWLGTYNQLTLVKGPAYPLFLALNSFTGIPLSLSEPTLYFGACLFFAASIYRVRPSRLLFFSVFAAALLCPAVYIVRDRVLREFFFDAELMVLMGLWMRLFLTGVRPGYLLMIASGLVLGLFWMTREESILIVPCLVVMAAFPLVNQFKGSLKPTLVTLVVVCASAVTVKTAVGTLNYVHYGRFVTDEMVDGSFQRVLVAMQRVGAVYNKPYVPVPKEAREAIAQQSPTFAMIKPTIDKIGVDAFCKITPESCGDIAGGYYLWAIRDAAATQGAHVSAAAAQAYYEKMAIEIEQACASGRLQCVSWLPPLIPPIPAQQWSKVPDVVERGVGIIFYQYNPKFHSTPTNVSPEGDEILRFLNNPLITDEKGEMAASAPRKAVAKFAHNLVHTLMWPAAALIALGALSLVPVAATTWHQRRDPLLWALVGLLVLAGSRFLLMILVDISSFPTLTYERFQSISLALSAASVLAVYLSVGIIRHWLESRS